MPWLVASKKLGTACVPTMTKRSENRRIEAKVSQMEEDLREFHTFTHKAWKEIKRDYKKMLNWYLFYQPKDSADKTWHLIGVVIADIILLKVFNLI
jgi:hypothetical protein